jgi:outer membrane protein assembly factor BamB/uncharacterized membrane protein HdeD (DUF308 family)
MDPQESPASPDSPHFDSPLPCGILRAFGRAIVFLVRVVGVVLVVGGAIALKVAARQNPAVALPISLAVFGGLALVFGATKVVAMLAADARREQPSPIIGGVKLTLGLALAGLMFFGWTYLRPLRFGVLDGIPYGWKSTLPYAIAAALGSVGVLAGAMSFFGRRPSRLMKWGLAAVVALGLGLGLPALSPLQRVAKVHYSDSQIIVFSDDGRQFATASGSTSTGDVRLFRSEPYEKLREFRAVGSGYDLELAFTADGKRLIVVDTPYSSASYVAMYEADSGDVAWKTELPDFRSASVELWLSADRRQLHVLASQTASGDREATAEEFVFDVASGEIVSRTARTLPEGSSRHSPDGRLIATAKKDDSTATIVVTDAATGAEVANFEVMVDRKIEYGVTLAFSPDGARLFVGVNGAAVVFDVPAKQKLWQIDTSEGIEFADVIAAQFSADGKRVLASLDEERLWLLDAADGAVLARLDRIPVWGIAWSRDGKWLVTGDNGHEGTILWDASGLAAK